MQLCLSTKCACSIPSLVLLSDRSVGRLQVWLGEWKREEAEEAGKTSRPPAVPGHRVRAGRREKENERPEVETLPLRSVMTNRSNV